MNTKHKENNKTQNKRQWYNRKAIDKMQKKNKKGKKREFVEFCRMYCNLIAELRSKSDEKRE